MIAHMPQRLAAVSTEGAEEWLRCCSACAREEAGELLAWPQRAYVRLNAEKKLLYGD
jgi:hypothetical protein